MICVDALKTYPDRPFGHEQWAHLWDSEADLEALHAFAVRIGLKRAWFQGKYRVAFFRHYDVTPSKHAAALRAGATLVSRQQLGAQFEAYMATDAYKALAQEGQGDEHS